MKKILLSITLLYTVNANAQTTAIPDVNFEQALIDLGIETGVPDGVILTSKIDTVTSLNVGMKNISDMTGIEDFVSLKYFWCFLNNLTSIDVSNSPALIGFIPANNNITSLDLSNNLALETLICQTNNLTSLQLSNQTFLKNLNASDNQLTCLNIKNGNNTNMQVVNLKNNPNLTCIEVDDATWSTTNWTSAGGEIDAGILFSTYCANSCSTASVGISELTNSEKSLIGIVDLMGRKTEFKPNTPLIYIYSDGTTKKVFTTESY